MLNLQDKENWTMTFDDGDQTSINSCSVEYRRILKDQWAYGMD